MATTKTAVPVEEPRVVIGVYVNSKAKEIYVDREPFYVHPGQGERVQWQCRSTEHTIHGPDCFTVEFSAQQNSPFSGKKFHHGQDSDVPDQNAKYDRYFKYSVTVPGVDTIDPLGGVRP